MVFLFVSNLVRNLELSLSLACADYDLEGRVHDHGFTLNPKPFTIDIKRRQR